MSDIWGQVITVGNITNATFLTRDISLANMLRRSIITEIETYAIHVVIFDVNTSARHDEIIAHRLGMCVINNDAYIFPGENVRISIDVEGPKKFTTDDIPEIPFAKKTPIAILRKGERIKFDVIVMKGKASQHAKWSPVSTVFFKEINEGFSFVLKDVGMMNPRRILQEGYNNIPNAIAAKPVDIFSVPVLPKSSLLNSSREILTPEKILTLIRSNKIMFPFKRTYSPSAESFFSMLLQVRPKVEIHKYKLYSYYPKYNLYLPPEFHNQPLELVPDSSNYNKIRILSDLFLEEERLKTRRYDQERSIWECWNDDNCLLPILMKRKSDDALTPENLRQLIYENIMEANTFNPAWARALILLVMGNDVSGKKWLDISAGWGDRMLAAMSLNMSYLGFDPNINLKKGHDDIIAKFGNGTQKVVYEPFEKEVQESTRAFSNQRSSETGDLLSEGPFDVVMSSPPFFNVEEYVKNQTGQSMVSYNTLELWLTQFLFKSIEKAWNNLKDNGYLILHLSDTRSLSIVEATNLFIETIPNASWEGVIGLQGESGYARPVWVWKKTTGNVIRWKPSVERSLQQMYPEIARNLK